MPVPVYCFYIVTEDGQEIKWINLTEIQAFRMNRTTEKNAPSNILKFGWGIMPHWDTIKAEGGKKKYASTD
jgi:hypothetical protein